MNRLRRLIEDNFEPQWRWVGWLIVAFIAIKVLGLACSTSLGTN